MAQGSRTFAFFATDVIAFFATDVNGDNDVDTRGFDANLAGDFPLNPGDEATISEVDNARSAEGGASAPPFGRID